MLLSAAPATSEGKKEHAVAGTLSAKTESARSTIFTFLGRRPPPSGFGLHEVALYWHTPIDSRVERHLDCASSRCGSQPPGCGEPVPPLPSQLSLGIPRGTFDPAMSHLSRYPYPTRLELTVHFFFKIFIPQQTTLQLVTRFCIYKNTPCCPKNSDDTWSVIFRI